MSQSTSQSDFIPYKFKDLKIYSSTEWLAGNRKKYRQVFEQKDVAYIYVELSLINKLYDRETWDASIVLKCYRLGKGKKEICNLTISRQVSKHDHIIFIREGWGHKTSGYFWKKGKYCWEAFMGDKKLAVKYFYVEDIASQLRRGPERALKVSTIRYFEGDYDHSDEEDKVYYSQFDQEETRYVFVELEIENRLNDHTWHSELFVKFYNNARELKGEVVRIQKIKKGEERLLVTAGWGSNVKGSWRKGEYSVEVIFQDSLLVKSRFLIGDSFEEGEAVMDYNLSDTSDGLRGYKYPTSAQNAFQELNQLIGLTNIKKQIHDHTQYLKFVSLRNSRGFNEEGSLSLHAVFTGNPGTGKTTVARLLGAIYHHLGILKRGHVHEVDRVDLVGEFIGQTAPKVKEAIEKARGGVLFIDEAYALARSPEDSKDFGREVIELLVKEMSQPDCDFMVIAAGYPAQMNHFIQSNPGLNSRFKYHYHFDDFTLSELFQIAVKFCSDLQVALTSPALKELNELIQEAYRTREHSFGNARFVGQMIEKAKINMGIRLMSRAGKTDYTDKELQTITLQDVLKLHKKAGRKKDIISIDDELLNSSLRDLDELIGLDSIKQKIHELIDVVRFKIADDHSVTGTFNMHTVMVGNPGTGKTTVTRILANIFKALGILEKGHIVETDRQGLVAGYVGQTALKTAEIIKKAKGGVLFIDEAYALNRSGSHNDFGDEAIQVLLKQMEDRRGEFFVFAAGYPAEMDAFLKMNPGLKSRFDHFFQFPDFSEKELMRIVHRFIKMKGYRISTHAVHLLKQQLEKEYSQRDKTFGNARRVRAHVDEIIKKQNLRISQEVAITSPHYRKLIKKVDVQMALDSMTNAYQYRKKSIGFSKERRTSGQ